MRQFDICTNADAVSRRWIPYWLIVQSDLIDASDSRVVIPLIPAEQAGTPLRGLMPELSVTGKRMIVDTMQITNVPLRMLGKVAGSATGERFAILAAIDMLTHGI